MEFRTESDSMGEVKVPISALYGASTQRAVENFQILGQPIPRSLIWALGVIKGAAAQVNGQNGRIDAELAEAIEEAATEIVEGKWDGHFPVDIFQTGSGTSSNTNINEVIAHRAGQILSERGSSQTVHPNDQVNFGQSSNDVFPSAIYLAAASRTKAILLPGLEILARELERKVGEFGGLVKSGRTHLMDATPLTLGQEFSGYVGAIRKGIERIEQSYSGLLEMALGGTAVGTGINCPAGMAEQVCSVIAKETGLEVRPAENHFEAQGGKDAAVEFSGSLKTVATSLFKICNDIRWLASGPVTGLAEIALPALQPGSSIMPSKVNPVIPEAVMMVCAQVIGNDATVTWAGANGNFELNVMMPVLARNLLESIELLGNGAQHLATKCVSGIEANPERLTELLEKNVIVVTALNPYIGYDQAAQVAKEAFARGLSVRAVVLEKGLMTETDLDQALDLLSMTRGG